MLQTYHEELFRLMFKQLELCPKISTDALCLLYETHLVLDSEHEETHAKCRMDMDAVQSLLEHYKEHRKDSRRCAERQRADIGTALRSLVEGSERRNVWFQRCWFDALGVGLFCVCSPLQSGCDIENLRCSAP